VAEAGLFLARHGAKSATDARLFLISEAANDDAADTDPQQLDVG
jgi:hypothetical protein